ncbi:MAG: beta-L-arabinofuranosidase domain-containing protein [Opitutus sp.]
MQRPLQLVLPRDVSLGGLLGQALQANISGHLKTFIQDEKSQPIALFSPAHVAHNHEGDWYGEHAGKWLYAAARAAHRTSDAGLAANVCRVANYLASVQEPSGYAGTYPPERRFMRKVPPGPRTWDGAPGQRTWDIWVHSYLILGLLETHKYFPNPTYLTAARRIGDLCWHTLTTGGINITTLGNHHGLSATVLLDPAVELYFATGEQRYLDLAKLVLEQANQQPALELLDQSIAGTDAAAIGTGKAYQLSWNWVGMAKLYSATGDGRFLQAVQAMWENVRRYHLTLGGGPWGGVAHRSREVFNSQVAFSPYGYVETCSTLSWIQLNRELLGITGEAKYAEEIEKSAYNDLLGAQAPAGDNWCYYSFPNGRRVFTTYWRCCKSSGPMALEELPCIAYSTTPAGDVAVNLYGPGDATVQTPAGGAVRLRQDSGYPLDGLIRLTVIPERVATFGVLVRIPSWSEGASIQVNGVHAGVPVNPNTYATLRREWQPEDVITMNFAMLPRLQEQTNRNVQESRTPEGAVVRQEVLRFDYVAITRGPLVYATGLIDGFKTEETIRLPDDRTTVSMKVLPPAPGSEAPRIQLDPGYRSPLEFRPYYEAGGRADGTWRLTWLQLAPNP